MYVCFYVSSEGTRQAWLGHVEGRKLHHGARAQDRGWRRYHHRSIVKDEVEQRDEEVAYLCRDRRRKESNETRSEGTFVGFRRRRRPKDRHEVCSNDCTSSDFKYSIENSGKLRSGRKEQGYCSGVVGVGDGGSERLRMKRTREKLLGGREKWVFGCEGLGVYIG